MTFTYILYLKYIWREKYGVYFKIKQWETMIFIL